MITTLVLTIIVMKAANMKESTVMMVMLVLMIGAMNGMDVCTML
jgi:hypothetical protein